MHKKTPLVELDYYDGDGRRFFAKLEGKNPSGSLKDRMIPYVIAKLEEEGRLKRGMTIIEASSGNTGISLARFVHELGYDVLICMPEHISPEKKAMMKQYGAEIKEFDTSKNSEADIEAACELTALLQELGQAEV